jgi:hypothetical protein
LLADFQRESPKTVGGDPPTRALSSLRHQNVFGASEKFACRKFARRI